MGGFVQLLMCLNGVNRYTMLFYNQARVLVETTHFGKLGQETYITSQDLQLKMNFISLNEKRQEWANPACEKTLVKYLLFNKPTLSASYKDYRTTFKYDLY
jgi:hypothetical protein